MFPSIKTKNPSPHTISIALDRFLSRSFQFSFFNRFNPEWAKFFQLWFCALNYSWPSINFHAAFFPSLKLHSLWQAINGHSDTLVTQKECGNIVSRLCDLSSVSSAVCSVRVPSWSPLQGAWHDTLRVECARKSPFETFLWLALAPGSIWFAFMLLVRFLIALWLPCWWDMMVLNSSVEIGHWPQFLILSMQEYLPFENQIPEYLFWKPDTWVSLWNDDTWVSFETAF